MIAALSKALSIAPDDAELFYLCGKAFQKNFARFSEGKNYNEEKSHEALLLALEDYSEAIRLNPGYAEAYLERGQIFDTMKNKKKAFADYNKAVKLDPENDFAYFLRGVIYGKQTKGQDKTPLALADLTRAIELNEDAASYWMREEIYECRREMDNAFADYRMAAKLMAKEGDNFYWNWLAEKYGELGDKRKELEALGKAIKAETDDSFAYSTRGNFYKEHGKYQKAITDYNKAIEQGNCWHYKDRAECYHRLDSYDAALADYGMAIKNLWQSDDEDKELYLRYLYYSRGTIYARLEKHGRAIADFTRALLYAERWYVLKNHDYEYMKIKKYGDAVNDFTAGTIYRFGIFVKEAGERMGRVRVFGVPVLRPFCGTVICLGLRIKDSVLDCPIGKM